MVSFGFPSSQDDWHENCLCYFCHEAGYHDDNREHWAYVKNTPTFRFKPGCPECKAIIENKENNAQIEPRAA